MILIHLHATSDIYFTLGNIAIEGTKRCEEPKKK